MSGLTPRELDVLRCARLGLSNACIGEALGLVESTVKGYMSNAMKRLGASNRTEAVYKATKEGFFID